MEDIKLNITPSGDGIHTILQGQAPEPLPTREPSPLQFVGQIDAVAEFIHKKRDSIYPLDSHVSVSLEHGRITLVTDENEYYKREITGKLRLSEDMDAFPINTGVRMSTFDLAAKIRMNRYYFTSTTAAMALVSELKSFKAKVAKELEKASDGQGNAKMLKEQVVDHNIPQSFQLTMHIYQRTAPVSFMVEVIVDADSLEVYLESPELRELMKGIREEALNDEISKIMNLLPELAILHQ